MKRILLSLAALLALLLCLLSQRQAEGGVIVRSVSGGGVSLPTTSLYAHWYADAGITKDGSDYVSSWVDQINSLDLAQGTGSSQPLWTNSVVNSLPVVRFDGTDDRLAGTWTAIGATSTVYVVFANRDAGAEDAIWHSSSYWGILKGTSLITSFYNNGARTFTNGTSDGAWQVVGVTRRADTVNYIKVTDASVQTLAGTSAGTLNNFSIGDRNFLSEPADCDIAEVLIYNAAHSDSQMQDVHDYLTDRYGL